MLHKFLENSTEHSAFDMRMGKKEKSKKREREEDHDDRPSKKAATGPDGGNLRVTWIPDSGDLCPVIGMPNCH
jgi:hypothetical protein